MVFMGTAMLRVYKPPPSRCIFAIILFTGLFLPLGHREHQRRPPSLEVPMLEVVAQVLLVMSILSVLVLIWFRKRPPYPCTVWWMEERATI